MVQRPERLLPGRGQARGDTGHGVRQVRADRGRPVRLRVDGGSRVRHRDDQPGVSLPQPGRTSGRRGILRGGSGALEAVPRGRPVAGGSL